MTKPPWNFLGLPVEKTGYKKSPVIVIPVPWEHTTSYIHGTREGPAAILSASHQVEFYDAELGCETWEPGIHTLDPIAFRGADPEQAFQSIEKMMEKILQDGKFPIALGGEHSLSAACVAAAAKKYPDLSILQIDAHADLRESYEGTSFSHACAMRLALRYVKRLSAVGIRSVCTEEVEFAKQHPEVKIFYDHERDQQPNWIMDAINHLTEHVYLTIDVDGFSPSIFPATGTPEPGGLSWYEGLNLIRELFRRKKVVAADVVELCPMEAHHASSFTAAKLVYKIIGYQHQLDRYA